MLGKTSGKKAPADKETWWQNKEVQQVVKWKKALKKKWDTSGSEEDREEYKEAKLEAWCAMAITKTRALDDVYAKLGTQEGKEKIFRIAQAHNKATKDLPKSNR